jgi:hypothetical protein
MSEPKRLEYTLDDHAPTAPAKKAIALHVEEMKRQTERRTGGHQQIAKRQLPDILREKTPLAEEQKEARLLEVAQHGRNHHDDETDPKEHKEAVKVPMLALRVEMRHPRCVLNRREQPVSLLRPFLLPRRRRRVDGRGSVDGDGSRCATASHLISIHTIDTYTPRIESRWASLDTLSSRSRD